MRNAACQIGILQQDAQNRPFGVHVHFQQTQRIEAERRREADYRKRIASQQAAYDRQLASLRQQNRSYEYRRQQDYLARLRAQQNQYRNYNNRYNYYNDPYYYTANNYRYQRDGRYYQTNVYGARLLKQAVNQGYAEGFRSGRADRMDRCFGYTA